MKRQHLTFLFSCALLLAMQLTAPAQTLVNRWSFNTPSSSTTVTDSVGGVVGTLQGTASIAGGPLTLDGSAGGYFSLSSNLLVGLQSVTLEGWADSAASPDNVHLFEFSDGVGTGNAYLRYVIHDTGNTRNLFEVANTTAGPNQGLSSPTGFGGVPLHVVCVYDPVNGVQAIYTNGVLEAIRYGVTTPVSGIATNEASLGQSPWFAYGDPYLAGTISEFRIWNGALNPLEVAASDAAGPGTVSTNAGTVTSVQLQVAFQMNVNALQQAVVIATATAIPNPVNIASLASYTSSNTNILNVSAFGEIKAISVGSASIFASYAGITNSQTITVVPPVATLTNRWSFSEPSGSLTVTDSVSGAIGTLQGGTTLDGSGSVTLDGSSGYVALPGLLRGLQSVVIETWVTNAVLPDNTCLFEFGDEAGTGANYFRYVMKDQSNGRNQFEIVSGSGTSQLVGHPGLGGQAVQVTCLYDPASQVQAIFTNGMLESYLTGVTIPLSAISTNGGTLGRSPWYAYGDPYLAGSIDEFRVYSGVKTPQQIALDYLAGPNSLATNDPGPLLSIALQVAPTMQYLASQNFGLLATYANLANFNLLANNLPGTSVPGLVVTSGNTNIITVNNTSLTAVGSGNTIITAVYQGITNSVAVTVLNPPLAPLLYRWSFNEPSGSTTVTDSVSGAIGTLNGAAAVNGAGQITLDGSSGSDVLLPGNMLTGLTNVTIEAWVSNTVLPDNTCLFSFDDGTGTGGHYLRDVIKDTSNSRNLFELTSSAGNSGLAGHPGLGGLTVDIVCIYDPVHGIQAMFTNGVLFASQMATVPLSGVATNEATLGQSPWFAYGDPYLAGSIDEFRIYGGRLLPGDIAASDIIGPNQLLTSTASLKATRVGGDLVLSWPVAASGFTLESSPKLGSGAIWTPVGMTPTVVGATNQVTLTPSGSIMFYRLQR